MDTVIRIKTLSAAALACIIAGPVMADELTEAAQGLCDSVRSCAIEQMAEQDLTPAQMDMMKPMLDNMCAAMREQVQEVPVDHGLYKWAVACMRSMQALSCEQLQSGQDITTQECQEYAEMAKEAGVDVGPDRAQ
jgi:hypothetical protein